MKSIISKSTALLAIAVTLFAFAPRFGGEGFEIALNGKTVIQRYNSEVNEVKTLQLNQLAATDKLTIKYHHCGRVGKNRIVTLKNEHDKMVKEWKYPDVATPVSAMACDVKDILNLKKSNSVLKLYYSSSELPKGRLLTMISSGNAMAKN